MKHRTLLTAVLLLLAANVHAQTFGDTPFGFKMGMSLAEVKALEGVVVDTMMEQNAWGMGKKKQVLVLSSAPVKDARFVKWDLYFTEKHGLYEILAASDTFRVGTGGQDIMPKYVALREDLTKAYNGYKKEAYAEGIGAWEPAGDWLNSVLSKTRRPDGRAFITSYRPSLKKSETMRRVELSILLSDPATMLVILGFRNSFDAVYGN